MRILFVIDTWGLIGGTERHAAVVVPGLVEAGHEVHVLCREDQAPGFADVVVHAMAELDEAPLAMAERRALAAKLRAVAPDVIFHSSLRSIDAAEVLVETAPVVRYVHDHNMFCPGLNKYRADGTNCREPMGFACLRTYFLGEGCVCFHPSGYVDNRLMGPVRDLRAKWRGMEIAKRSARVLTNSHYMRDELLSLGFAPEATDVLYYFTQSNTDAQPTGALSPETTAFLSESSAPLVFTPARLTLPDKGVDYLLKALAAVQTDFRAVIAGSGPAEDELRELARENGLDERVHFSGWTDSGGVETLYQRADLVVCPSVWDEPFGLVGIEAMAHETPVVAFDVGGIPEWLRSGENGRCVPRKDTVEMAAAIEELLSDRDERERLGRQGRRMVEETFPRERHLESLTATLTAAAGA